MNNNALDMHEYDEDAVRDLEYGETIPLSNLQDSSLTPRAKLVQQN